MKVDTVQNSPVSIDVTDGAVKVDEATVVHADIETDNGVIHVIDMVIMPGMWREAAGGLRRGGEAAPPRPRAVPAARPAGAPPRSSGRDPRQGGVRHRRAPSHMVYGAIRQSPVFGGKLQSIPNRADVEARKGVIAVVPLDDAVVVVAEHFWQAKTAADALDVAWDKGAAQGSTMPRSWRCSAPGSMTKGRSERSAATSRGRSGGVGLEWSLRPHLLSPAVPVQPVR